MKCHSSSLYVYLMVLASALATACSARRDREETLKQDLRMMRKAIDNYTLYKQHAPQSLQDLVDGALLKGDSDGPVYRQKRLGAAIRQCGADRVPPRQAREWLMCSQIRLKWLARTKSSDPNCPRQGQYETQVSPSPNMETQP